MRAKLTQAFVDRQPLTRGGKWFHDTELRGFVLYVGETCKTFYASAEHRGRLMRRKIGRTDVYTASEARKLARGMLADMRRGIDPTPKREPEPSGETLAEALETYLARKRLKPSSAVQYRDAFKRELADWQRRGVAELTRAEIDRRHRSIGKRAPYSANLTMRVLKAVLADAVKRELIASNPCDVIEWFDEARRTTRIGARLPEWWQAVNALAAESPLRAACMKALLFGGWRLMEACRLRWDDCELDGDAPTALLRDRKRGPDLVVPLSRQAADVLRSIKPVAEAVRPGSPFCFPSYGRRKHIVTPNDATIPNTTHDVRREWLSTAAELGISLILAKAAVGHSLGGDVTSGYFTQLDVRNVIQRVADELERRALDGQPRTRSKPARANRAPARETTPADVSVPADPITLAGDRFSCQQTPLPIQRHSAG